MKYLLKNIWWFRFFFVILQTDKGIFAEKVKKTTFAIRPKNNKTIGDFLLIIGIFR